MHSLQTEAIGLGSMQGFCHVISDHLMCGTIFDIYVAFGLLIGDVEVLDVQMMRVLASTLASICLKQHGTFCCPDRGCSPSLDILVPQEITMSISLGRQFHQWLPLPLQ